jgi:hypothetical protein
VTDYLEVRDADALTADAARMMAEGENLRSMATRRTAAIQSIEAEQPWGSDKYGEAFTSGYFSTEHSDTPASQAVQQNLTDLGDHAVDIGEAATWAMTSYTSTDTENATDLGNVG